MKKSRFQVMKITVLLFLVLTFHVRTCVVADESVSSGTWSVIMKQPDRRSTTIYKIIRVEDNTETNVLLKRNEAGKYHENTDPAINSRNADFYDDIYTLIDTDKHGKLQIDGLAPGIYKFIQDPSDTDNAQTFDLSLSEDGKALSDVAEIADIQKENGCYIVYARVSAPTWATQTKGYSVRQKSATTDTRIFRGVFGMLAIFCLLCAGKHWNVFPAHNK